MNNLSGIWFNPSHEGTGFTIADWKDGLILYWFSYADGFPMLSERGQMWLMCQAQDNASRENFLMYKPSGNWMGGNHTLGDPVGRLSLVELENGNLEVTYRFTKLGPCAQVMVSPVWQGCGGKFEIQRLSPTIARD